jgi:hypothetical protein
MSTRVDPMTVYLKIKPSKTRLMGKSIKISEDENVLASSFNGETNCVFSIERTGSAKEQYDTGDTPASLEQIELTMKNQLSGQTHSTK